MSKLQIKFLPNDINEYPLEGVYKCKKLYKLANELKSSNENVTEFKLNCRLANRNHPEHYLYVHASSSSGLVFNIEENGELILVEEWREYTNPWIDFYRQYHNIKVGESILNNISEIFDIFVNYGKAKNKKNPTMDVLLNNRFCTTKSANNVS